MQILSIIDPLFSEYGRIVKGVSTTAFVKALAEKTPLPENVQYVAEEPALQNLPEAAALAESLYGGMPTQFGWCNGHNTKLNCFEYHRSSEFNLGSEDFILLLAKQSDVHDGQIKSSATKAFRVPAGVLVEVYATSLHYAPCHADGNKGFKVMIVLPENTNVGDMRLQGQASDDKMLWMRNKWLIAHKDAAEANDGAYVGITGINIDIASDI